MGGLLSVWHGILADLHWLPVEYRIQFKIAVTTFKVFSTCEPTYLADIIRFYCIVSCDPVAKSAAGHAIETRFRRTSFLPRRTCSLEHFTTTFNADLSSITTFKRLLKTEFYNRAFRRSLVTVPHLRFFTPRRT